MEILLSLTGFFLFMVIVMNAYSTVIKLRYNIQARISLIESSYYVFEKLNLLLKDYTIDYEEYFNRWHVGCDSGHQSNFLWAVNDNGYCDNFTAYGNNNGFLVSSGVHSTYYCSSKTGYLNGSEYVVYNSGMSTLSQGCFSLGFQSFGQYRWQFWDMNDDADSATGVLNDGDDINYGKGPDAILDSTGVKELYLISQDNSRRIFLRRALVESGDWNGNGVVSGVNEKWYTIQILKLRGFDAGSKHDFDVSTSNGVYDGTIDTWVCDYAQGFICNGTGIGNVYSGYRLPLDQNDGWVNLFEKNITISDWNISIYPTKYSEYAWAEDALQLNPYFVLAIQSKLYGEIWQKRLYDTMSDFQFSLQTMFNIKNFYTK